MMNKKKAVKMAYECENIVYTSKQDIADLIQLHARLGFFEMEVFATKNLAKRCTSILNKKGFYTRVIEFESLKNDCRLYVSWISNL